jgi:predicted ATPase/transcriptional regulator with XRE-family HTH domain
MTPQNDKGTIFIGEDDFPLFFGKWIKRRRKSLDMTQDQLAKRVCCSVHTIRKIEMGERRPSKQLAELLANLFGIPSDQLPTFLKAARGELSVESLRSLTHDPVYQPAGSFIPTPGYLPRSLTPFIGRVPEISAVGELLQDSQCSLLTIAGPGGIGKTRLAVEAAHRSKDLYPDGVWFVSLAPLNSPSLIVPTIAEALNYKFQDPTNPKDQLIRYLRTKMALLVLDNAEHLLEGVDVFAEILEGCPQVKLLVTSRERLNLLSEWVFEIQGLPLPPGDQVEQFEAYSSVALFLQSARRVLTGFEIREAERIWVLRICQAMEGMPLGIELSAAWLGLLSCEEIAKEIEKNLDFLSVSMRDLPERHRSLRATLDHSWRLLNEEEKLVLCRLSVFPGSFSLEAAQAIGGASMVHLSSLRNKCLLYRTDQEMYHLHEIIRQYAGLKLGEYPDENEQVKDRHAAYYVQSLSKWEKALQSSQQLETFHEMAQTVGNLAQGWQHMITNCRPGAGNNNSFCAELLHSALFSISLFYEMRCRSYEAIALFTESVGYLKSVQGEFENTEDSSLLISVLGHITAYLGLHHIYILQYGKAEAYLEEAIKLLEESQSTVEQAQTQIMLAAVYYRQGKLERSSELHERSRDVLLQAGEHWWYLLSLINLARTYLPMGKFQECEAIYQEGFRLVEPGDLRLELPLRMGFAYLRYLRKDFARAEQLMQENLELCYRFENHIITASTCIYLSQVALSTKRVELAEQYLHEALGLLSKLGESDELAGVLLYLGKCFLIRSDLEAAREKFREVIKIGLALDLDYTVYWGLIYIARTDLLAGKTGSALKIAQLLKDCPIEHKQLQEEVDCLLAELQTLAPEWKMEAVTGKVSGNRLPDEAIALTQEYARGLVFE